MSALESLTGFWNYSEYDIIDASVEHCVEHRFVIIHRLKAERWTLEYFWYAMMKRIKKPI